MKNKAFSIRYTAVALALILLPFFIPDTSACTGIAADTDQGTLLGCNEDWPNPYAFIKITPPETGKYGTLLFDFQTGGPPFSGINDQGLAFDLFGLPEKPLPKTPGKPHADQRLISRIITQCATVEEAIEMMRQYNPDFLRRIQMMFVDQSGDAAIIETNEIIHRKTAGSLVVTNFRQSDPDPETYPCPRYAAVTEALKHNPADLPLMEKLLYTTRMKDPVTTQYSTIYDLKRGIAHLYLFHDFNTRVSLNLREEIAKGKRTIALADLFPANSARAAYIAHYRKHSNNPFISPAKTAFVWGCGLLFLSTALISLRLKGIAFKGAWAVATGAAVSNGLSIVVISRWPIMLIWGLPTPKVGMATPAEKLLFCTPWISIILTLATGVFAMISWRNKYWSTPQRVYFSLTAVGSLLFVIFLHYHLFQHPL